MEVREIKAEEAQQRLAEGRAELVDIRDAGERKGLYIPDARWIPLAGLEAGLKAEPRQAVGIFHCRSGRRTRAHAERLAAVGYPETYLLEGGIMAWQKAGYPVASEGGRIDVMRQVQMVAGTLIMLGFGLGMWVAPGFYWLSGLVGAGLFYAGASGSCTMAAMLAKLPYNR